METTFGTHEDFLNHLLDNRLFEIRAKKGAGDNHLYVYKLLKYFGDKPSNYRLVLHGVKHLDCAASGFPDHVTKIIPYNEIVEFKLSAEVKEFNRRKQT